MKPKLSRSASVLFFASLAASRLVSAAAPDPTPPPAPRGTKIGVVDPAKVLDKLVSWKAARAKLATQEKNATDELAKQKKEIDRLRDELDYFQPGSRDHQQRQAELADRQERFRRAADRLRQELTDASREALETATAALRRAVKEYAIAHGYDVVVDARTAFYVAGGVDISLEVARAMNKRYKDKSEGK